MVIRYGSHATADMPSMVWRDSLRFMCLIRTSMREPMPGLIPEDEAIVAEAQAMIEAAIAKL